MVLAKNSTHDAAKNRLLLLHKPFMVNITHCYYRKGSDDKLEMNVIYYCIP